MSVEKKELRNKFLQIRNSIDDNARICMSEEVTERLLKTDAYTNASAVFAYVSVGSEVDTRFLLERILKDGKRLVVPKCNTKEHVMELYEITSLNQLDIGTYNIPEPSETAIHSGVARCVGRDAVALAVVPALAFDRSGARLGYGGGYYDRFLDGFSGYAVGLAYPQCMADELPHEDFDCRVNEVICAKEME